MGGGLAFLNKKSWHTGGFKQQEEVWKREHEADKEAQRIAELQKQLHEERELKNLHEEAIAGGHLKREERLEFMYSSVLAKKRDDQDTVAAMSKTVELETEDKKLQQVAAGAAGSLFTDDTPKAANEQWNKLHGDPLLMMRQQEQTAMKHVKNNPVKMAAIKAEVEKIRSERNAKKAAKKEKKEAKKAAKKAKKESKRDHEGRGASSSRSPSPTPTPAAAPPLPDFPPGGPAPSERSRPAAGGREGRMGDERGQGLHEPRRERERSREPRDGDGRRERGRDGDRGRGRSRSRSRERDWDRRRGSEQDRDSHRGRGRDSHRDRDRDRSREHRAEHDRHRARGDGGGHRDDRKRAREEERSDAAQGKRRRDGEEAGEEPPCEAPRAAGVMDGACAQKPGKGYGLDTSSIPKAVLQQRASAPKVEKREKTPPPAPIQKSAPHRTGRLSQEEMAARLAAMASDAETHETLQRSRVGKADQAARHDQDQEAERTEKETASFLDNASKSIYGATEGGSLADRVGRRAWYREKGKEAQDQNAFRRH